MKFAVSPTIRVAIALLLVSALGACGNKGGVKTCDKPQRYQESVENERVRSPDDLDNLDSLREMPVPQANPSPDRPPGSPCLELPPRIISTD